MKKFDLNAYHERLKQRSPGDHTGDTKYVGSNGSTFRDFTIKTGIVETEIPPTGNIVFYREYFLSGNLHREGTLSRFGERAALGVWKTYDENGNLETSEDHEQGFQIGYSEILKILEKRKVKLAENLNITRSEPGKPPTWVVRWTTGYGPIPGFPVGSAVYSQGLRIDGITGVVTEIPNDRP